VTPRRILLGSFGVLLLLCGGGVALVTVAIQPLDTAGEVEFTRPLAVPPLAPSTVDAQGRRVFDLTAAQGRHAFGDIDARTWGYNGSYLGPTLRATRGEQVVVNIHNGLVDATTVHWHGMHLPSNMDGGPHQRIEPGATWSPTWRIDQPAATLWYHPHPHEETAGQVYRGLAGLFLVDDPATDAPALPHTYGVDDFPVIVQDKQFDGDELDEGREFLGGVGILGDTIAVNGTVGPYLDVSSERVRLRLLNASNARVYGFGFTDDRTVAIVGSDGGLLPAPVPATRVTLSPGERAEIVVTLRPGERTVLRSFPPDLGLDPLSRAFSGAADTLDILELRAAPTLTPALPLPPHLVDVPPLDAAHPAQLRSFGLADTMINNQRMDMSRVDATVTAGTTEVWRVVNNDGSPHNFHIHGVQFQVRGGVGVSGGWKDTVFLRPHTTYELVVPFGPYADPTSPYMYHCHLLYHEDQAMMGQFVVVNPGQSTGTVPGHAGHGSVR
jgi:FtsP/CotA-like multicopper oxidase with cupredoxin domain